MGSASRILSGARFGGSGLRVGGRRGKKWRGLSGFGVFEGVWFVGSKCRVL